MSIQFIKRGGGGGFPPDWSEIGYEETPSSVIDNFNYAKDIKDNWDSSITKMTSKYRADVNLYFFPLVDTSNVTDMRETFYASALTNIALIDTSNVTTMNKTFYSCTRLKTIPLLNTDNVTNMGSTFYNCQRLLNIPLINTSSATRMDEMFRGCGELISIPELNTENVSNFSYCFYGCTKLKDVPVFNVNSVSGGGFTTMFGNCPSLTDESLNNILQMCINAVNITQAAYKTLSAIGLSQTQAEICETLPNYQAFIDAGWTIGY